MNDFIEEPAELTTKQLLFCEAYLSNGFNLSKAVIEAGYNTSNPRNIGAENYAKPYIKEYIQKRVRERLKGHDELQEQWLNEVMAISFSDPTQDVKIVTETELNPVLDKRGRDTGREEEVQVQRVQIKDTKDIDQSKAIKSIKEDRFGVITVEYHDKTKGLDLLGKYLSILTEKKEIDITVNKLPILNIVTTVNNKE